MLGKLERKSRRSRLSLGSRALGTSAAKLDFDVILMDTRQADARCDFSKLVLACVYHNFSEKRFKIGARICDSRDSFIFKTQQFPP